MGNEWSWRIPGIVQALPSVIQLAFIYWVPESPRYLIAHDKSDQALNMLATYHANGNVNHPTVQFEYREIKETLAKEMEVKKSASYLDFFRTKGNRYRFFVLVSLGFFSQWSGNAIISNYANKLYESAGIHGEVDKFGVRFHVPPPRPLFSTLPFPSSAFLTLLNSFLVVKRSCLSSSPPVWPCLSIDTAGGRCS